ncbi:MAG TPA: hypothetical protein VFS24_06375 [Steroidobacteraceae bacterium]|nr:hypothetical protein [Steroidobacteraceae bacterium]
MSAVIADRPLPSREEIESFVLAQFKIFGPQSKRTEHFAFVYWHDGELAQAHIYARCSSTSDRCTTNPKRAIQAVMPGAKILAEWHSHPHNGSRLLSPDDAQGAFSIGEQIRSRGREYFAYYSDPTGRVFRWDTTTPDVNKANRSRVEVGSYCRLV